MMTKTVPKEFLIPQLIEAVREAGQELAIQARADAISKNDYTLKYLTEARETFEKLLKALENAV